MTFSMVRLDAFTLEERPIDVVTMWRQLHNHDGNSSIRKFVEKRLGWMFYPVKFPCFCRNGKSTPTKMDWLIPLNQTQLQSYMFFIPLKFFGIRGNSLVHAYSCCMTTTTVNYYESHSSSNSACICYCTPMKTKIPFVFVFISTLAVRCRNNET